MARDRGIEIASPRGAGEGGRGRRTLAFRREKEGGSAGSASTFRHFPARVHQDMTMK